MSKIVDIDEPPKKIILGGTAYDQVLGMDDARLNEYRKWEYLSREADYVDYTISLFLMKIGSLTRTVLWRNDMQVSMISK